MKLTVVLADIVIGKSVIVIQLFYRILWSSQNAFLNRCVIYIVTYGCAKTILSIRNILVDLTS